MKDPRKELARSAVWIGRTGALCVLVAAYCLAQAFWADDHDVAFGWCMWAMILAILAGLCFLVSSVGRSPHDELADLYSPDEGPPPIVKRKRGPQTTGDILGKAERGRQVHDEIAEALQDPDKWERKRMEREQWTREQTDPNSQVRAYIDLTSEVVVDMGRLTEYAPGWHPCPMCGGVQRAEPCALCSDAGAIHVDGI